jgi:hypothetical protein
MKGEEDKHAVIQRIFTQAIARPAVFACLTRTVNWMRTAKERPML